MNFFCSQIQKFQFCQSYIYVNRKVWCQAFWIWKQKKFILPDLTYMPLLGPTRLLISKIFPSKPDFHLYKWEKKPSYMALSRPTRLLISEKISHLHGHGYSGPTLIRNSRVVKNKTEQHFSLQGCAILTISWWLF